MRKPRKYVSPTTGAESWKVRYRSATGTEKSETFYTEDDAVEFSHLLRALGAPKALAYLDAREKTEGGGVHALTVADVWAKWFDWKFARRKDGTLVRVRSERTPIDYQRMYDLRLGPRFGDKPANLIAPADVQKWVDDLGSEIEPKTIADYHSLLHGMYLWAVHPSRGLVIADPCTDTDLPERRKKKAKGLRPEEWHILHAAAREVDSHAADVLLFMVATGWRWSECAAVQAMAVDHWEQAGETFTYVTMGRVLRREGNTFVFVDDAKSEAGERRVRLRGHAELMVLRRIEGKAPDALILTTKRGAPWNYNHFHQRIWTRPTNPKHDDARNRKRILERAAELGLNQPNLTMHWLRHTSVGMLILAGEPLTAISRRIGHASIKTTVDVYGRMVDDTSLLGLDRAAAMIDGPG